MLGVHCIIKILSIADIVANARSIAADVLNSVQYFDAEGIAARTGAKAGDEDPLSRPGDVQGGGQDINFSFNEISVSTGVQYTFGEKNTLGTRAARNDDERGCRKNRRF